MLFSANMRIKLGRREGRLVSEISERKGFVKLDSGPSPRSHGKPLERGNPLRDELCSAFTLRLED